MEVLYARCCGLDMHQRFVVACLSIIEAGKSDELPLELPTMQPEQRKEQAIPPAFWLLIQAPDLQEKLWGDHLLVCLSCLSRTEVPCVEHHLSSLRGISVLGRQGHTYSYRRETSL
jgi:hypothetical protein